jgi:hypothetical protein
MSKTRVDFDALAWQETQSGSRFKSVVRDGTRLRLLELTREFVEPDWCLKRHAGCVLEGELEITFDGRAERFRAGDGLFITGGDAERHRARAVGERVRLLLVEDA